MDIQPQGASACHYRLKLLLIYLLLVAVEIVLIRRAGHGIFSYSLDDPYIHLALAQRILHGHYGLNAGEAASPSSSVLWPFLLAPISTVSFRAWSPLLLNVAAGCGACVLLDKLLRRWNVLCFQPRSIAQVVQWLFAFLLVLAGNLVGLAIVGMEHTLQVLLMIGCVYGLLEVYADRPIPRWVLVMAAVAPAVPLRGPGLYAGRFGRLHTARAQKRRSAHLRSRALAAHPLWAVSACSRIAGAADFSTGQGSRRRAGL